MTCLVAVAVAALQLASPPLAVEARREAGVLVVCLELLDPLPEAVDDALPSGAEITIRYAIRLRGERRLLWDRRVWRGMATSTVTFDPVIGRYRAELALDEVLLESEELASADAARRWLAVPPCLRLSLPPGRREPRLRLHARAVYSQSTTWLVFPSTEGTEWIEVPVETTP